MGNFLRNSTRYFVRSRARSVLPSVINARQAPSSIFDHIHVR